MICPVKNKRYLELLKELGSDEAVYKVWVENDYKLPGDIEEIEPVKPITKFEKQFVYFKRLKTRLVTKQKEFKKDSEKWTDLELEIRNLDNKLEIIGSETKQNYQELGDFYLNRAEKKINSWENRGDIKPEDLFHTIETVSTFILTKKEEASLGLESRAKELYDRLVPFIESYVLSKINGANPENDLTLEDIRKLTTDISSITLYTGALADIEDILARTIGTIIKTAQNNVISQDKQVTDKIEKEIKLLQDWSKKNGVTDIYEPFIQNIRGNTILTQQYTTDFYNKFWENIRDTKSNELTKKIFARKWLKDNSGRDKDGNLIATNAEFINKDYLKIQNTLELKQFYDFYQELMLENKAKLPVDINTDFIANIKKSTMEDFLASEGLGSKLGVLGNSIKNIVEIKNNIPGQFTSNEALFADIIPIKYVKKISGEEKSRNLGSSLLIFTKFVNNYQEMDKVLPVVRLLQEEIKRKEYIKSSKPNERVIGEQSNIFKFTDDVIKMQVKGETKKEQGKIKVNNVYDNEGNPIGEKYILTSDLIDIGLRYNSLLRIGLNPINAVTNVLIGDIGNIVESFGGRFYTLSNLKDASNIFMKQNLDEKSALNKWLEKLNPLSELEDYDQIDRVSVGKKLTPDKLKNIMYSPQKVGEKWLQTRTMLAVLIKEGLIDNKGKTTKKGEELTEEQINDLSNKIQRINQMIHGRYSQKDAAIAQQFVLYRMISQFRKWLPAAFEQRLGTAQYDARLKENIEGRYRTAWRLIQATIKGDLDKLKTSNLSELELYNMRKNFAELTILAASMLLFYGLKGDKDDDEWRKKPDIKFTLDQLNRVAGDLQFFYTPEGSLNTATNAVPLAKVGTDLYKAFFAIPFIFTDEFLDEKSTYQKGKRKGENKFFSSYGDLIPGYKPVKDFTRLFKEVAYEEPRK